MIPSEVIQGTKHVIFITECDGLKICVKVPASFEQLQFHFSRNVEANSLTVRMNQTDEL